MNEGGQVFIVNNVVVLYLCRIFKSYPDFTLTRVRARLEMITQCIIQFIKILLPLRVRILKLDMLVMYVLLNTVYFYFVLFTHFKLFKSM